MQFNFKSKIGLGTWQMGQNPTKFDDEVHAVEHALAVGYELIDTAEMYANGVSEKIVGQALKNFGTSKRNHLTLVSKVLPSNASKSGVIKACEASLKRMGCEYLDVYLLHWQSSSPIQETIEGFMDLEARGLIKHHGVSNFDVGQMKKWLETEKTLGASKSVTNQVYYALNERGVEFDLIDYLDHEGISTMAYSPLGTGQLARHKDLTDLANKLALSAAQLALAWAIRKNRVIAIPKSVTPSRISENLKASEINLNHETLSALDSLFQPPRSKKSLAVI
jgi:diketogulonate reductase-like aldo/keto reductase